MMLMIQAEELGKELVTGLFPITKKMSKQNLKIKEKSFRIKEMHRKLEGTIRVHAEVGKSIKNAA